MGLFISFTGFSNESLEVQAPGIKSMILMDGNDLMAVLDERIDLPELMYRKRRHASETGNIYLKVSEITIKIAQQLLQPDIAIVTLLLVVRFAPQQKCANIRNAG